MSLSRFFLTALFVCCAESQQIAWTADFGASNSIAVVRSGKSTPGELLVKFRPGVSEARIKWILQQVGGQSIESIATIRLHRVRIADDRNLAQIITILEGFPEVEYAEPNLVESMPLPR